MSSSSSFELEFRTSLRSYSGRTIFRSTSSTTCSSSIGEGSGEDKRQPTIVEKKHTRHMNMYLRPSRKPLFVVVFLLFHFPTIAAWAPHVTSPLLSTSSTTAKPSSKRKRIFSRIKDTFTNKERNDEELKIGIAGFYDRSSKLWEDVWGEHMHHGYYIPEDRTDHIQAQIDLIDEVLKWADVDEMAAGGRRPTKMVDVGCGIGGSSRHIAKKYQCTARGITLSPYQAARGNELAKEQDVADLCSFQVADALDQPFPNDEFDLVWSLESGEHMPHKDKFVGELFRVAKPGGRIIIVTWCHRDLEAGEKALTRSEERLLKKINRAYYLPQWCSSQDYVDLLTAQGATDIKRDDWSYIIAPFWKAVIKSSLNVRSLWGLLKSGPSTLRGAWAMTLMLRGHRKGLIKFSLLTCTKPATPTLPPPSPPTPQ